MARRIPEDTPRTLFVTLGIWGVAVIVGALDGVFTKFAPAELAGLATFAFAFALAATYLDPSLRTYLLSASTRSYLTFAIEVDLGIGIGTMLALGFAGGDMQAALTRFPLAAVILFAAPVAAVGHWLLAERLLRRRPASASLPAALQR